MIKKIFKKYREIISYLFFGVLTTAVGMGTYFLILYASRLCGINEGDGAYNAVRVAAQIIQWVLAVLFAYYTNKKFVFLVKSREGEGAKKEETTRVAGFFLSRLFSLLCDSAVTFGTIFVLTKAEYVTKGISLPFDVEFFVTKDLIAKLLAAVVVIVVNYVLSKFIVFKNKGE